MVIFEMQAPIPVVIIRLYDKEDPVTHLIAEITLRPIKPRH